MVGQVRVLKSALLLRKESWSISLVWIGRSGRRRDGRRSLSDIVARCRLCVESYVVMEVGAKRVPRWM
eukprot:2650137-Alexandrium_andersonii.AAC.1